MPLIAALVVVASAVVLPSGLAAPNGARPRAAGVMHGRFFRMPGNPLACEVDNPAAVGPFKGHTTLFCVVFSKSGKRGQRTWEMRSTGKPRVSWVEGNIADTTPFLAYGHSWSYGGFRCRSRRSGLTCHNRSHHGWVLSAKAQRTF